MTSRILIAALMVILACGAAQARQIRFPEKTIPAVTFELPDGWTNAVDADDNSQSTAPDRSVLVQYALLESPQALDEMAAAILVAATATPFNRRTDGAIDGASGYTYFSTLPINGQTLNVQLTLVKLDGNWVLANVIMFRSDANATLADAMGIVKSTKIIQPGK